jgi:CDP-glucose 4,6-dehydratase
MVKERFKGWSGRRVLVTGHTGFKGGWLSLWLAQLGADVHGYALGPPTQQNFFETAKVRSAVASDTRADLANLNELRRCVLLYRPQVVFHLAAQPLVREGYRDPVGTLASNVIVTAHVLQAVLASQDTQAVVAVTTDKVYRNDGSVSRFQEHDALGGRDPYSASKAAAELVVASYRDSFFGTRNGHPARIATVRAGNVIGGGDWAQDRLVPDCLRAFAAGKPVSLRYPDSVRPWQHVLEPLAGYLQLAEELLGGRGEDFADAWNFGPNPDGDGTVGAVAAALALLWGDAAGVSLPPQGTPNPLHEAGELRLDSTRAHLRLGWQPRWSVQEALVRTVAWHRSWMAEADMWQVSLSQIADYEAELLT